MNSKNKKNQFDFIKQRAKDIPQKTRDMVKAQFEEMDRKAEIEEIVMKELELWYDSDKRKVEINAKYLAEKLCEWFEGKAFYNLIDKKTIPANKLRAKGEKYFDEYDMEGMIGETPKEVRDRRVYAEGYLWGYVHAFQALTDEDYKF